MHPALLFAAMFDPHLSMTLSGEYTRRREEEEAQRKAVLEKVGPPPDPVPEHTWVLDTKRETWVSIPDDIVRERPANVVVVSNPAVDVQTSWSDSCPSSLRSDRRPLRSERVQAAPDKKRKRKAQRVARRKNR